MKEKPLCEHCGVRHNKRAPCPGIPTDLQHWYEDWERRKKAKGEWESKKSFKSNPLRGRRPKGRVTLEELKEHRSSR